VCQLAGQLPQPADVAADDPFHRQEGAGQLADLVAAAGERPGVASSASKPASAPPAT
jgi:hypothetical protein